MLAIYTLFVGKLQWHGIPDDTYDMPSRQISMDILVTMARSHCYCLGVKRDRLAGEYLPVLSNYLGYLVQYFWFLSHCTALQHGGSSCPELGAASHPAANRERLNTLIR